MVMKRAQKSLKHTLLHPSLSTCCINGIEIVMYMFMYCINRLSNPILNVPKSAFPFNVLLFSTVSCQTLRNSIHNVYVLCMHLFGISAFLITFFSKFLVD